MNHYTTVKTNMFNGIQHPSIWWQPETGDPILLRNFTYKDYKTECAEKLSKNQFLKSILSEF